MRNLMKEYLGNDYSDNHLKNFCLYWMKGRETKPKWENTEESRARFNDWRRKNDLDCRCFDGDLRADTLMSAWTPISWVVNCLNREHGIRFCKEPEDDPNHYLRLLVEDRDAYLPPKNELVQLLDRFLELAELRCNYILLPDRDMNNARYNCNVGGETVNLYDEVPPMLYHIFDRDWFGKYFEKADPKSDVKSVQTLDAVKWVKRERLEAGFRDGIIDQNHVIPLLENLHPGKGKKLKEEAEIREALIYMINLLESRRKAMEKTPYIMFAEEYELDCGMGYYAPYIYGEALMEDGTIIPIFSEIEFNNIEPMIFSVKSPFYRIYTERGIHISDAYVRNDYKEVFEPKRKKGRTYFSILHEIANEICCGESAEKRMEK